MDKMNLKKVPFWVVFVGMIPFLSCNLEDDSVNFHFVNLQVVDAKLPAFFELNQSYEIQVTYVRPNNCTFFEGFSVDKTGHTARDVVVVGSQLEDGNCVQVAEEVVGTFMFTCYYTDSYTFRFWTGEDVDGNPQFLEYQIPVTSP